jgi:hypothetical protein
MPDICDDCGPPADPIFLLALLVLVCVAGFVAVRRRQWPMLVALWSAPFATRYVDTIESALAVTVALLLGILAALALQVRRNYRSRRNEAA